MHTSNNNAIIEFTKPQIYDSRWQVCDYVGANPSYRTITVYNTRSYGNIRVITLSIHSYFHYYLTFANQLNELNKHNKQTKIYTWTESINSKVNCDAREQENLLCDSEMPKHCGRQQDKCIRKLIVWKPNVNNDDLTWNIFKEFLMERKFFVVSFHDFFFFGLFHLCSKLLVITFIVDKTLIFCIAILYIYSSQSIVCIYTVENFYIVIPCSRPMMRTIYRFRSNGWKHATLQFLCV
jgi:hypothetical protein